MRTIPARLRGTRKARALAIVPLAVTALASWALAAGCAGPGYYAQAAKGQWRLVRDARPVEEVLADQATAPELAARLATTQEILAFAETRLALEAGGRYREYVATGREAVVWNVVAAPEFSLAPKRWCFLVAGCVPYRGYFAEEDALRLAEKLARKGLDTAVVGASAYSTLGWFDDPLLDTMLRGEAWRLAAHLFHELAHVELYLPGDTAFSEGYARFVERAGMEAWLAAHGSEAERSRWAASLTAAEDFAGLLRETRERLSTVYASGAAAERMRADKRAAFEALRAGWARLREERWGGVGFFAGWFDAPLNNARLALMQSYEGGQCAFAALLEQADGDLGRFHALARARSALPGEERAAWLATPCDPVAPVAQL